MSKIIVADTGPLIALARVELISVLSKLFDDVVIPDAVLKEAISDISKPGADAIIDAIHNGELRSSSVEITPLYELLIDILDQGEVEALALADKLGAIALIDERRGRKVAQKQAIPVVGSAAILLKAKSSGYVQAVAPLLDQLSVSGYRMSNALKMEVLRRAGER